MWLFVYRRVTLEVLIHRPCMLSLIVFDDLISLKPTWTILVTWPCHRIWQWKWKLHSIHWQRSHWKKKSLEKHQTSVTCMFASLDLGTRVTCWTPRPPECGRAHLSVFAHILPEFARFSPRRSLVKYVPSCELCIGLREMAFFLTQKIWVNHIWGVS